MYWMFLPFRRYFDFSGRSRRLEYWMFILFNLILIFALGTLALVLVERTGSGGEAGFGLLSILPFIYVLTMVCPMLAVQVRRFHDQDKSGWHVLLGLIPYVGSFIILFFMVQKGTPGENAYGPDPLGPGIDISDFM
ncbi:DUF805 domain-containing protein [Altererythrobacter fulvus]|uniref:DUF805 domain-containing protein n=1 Tax=Caenibius fulvus TaxID=2126012 RepID=UPI00301B136F